MVHHAHIVRCPHIHDLRAEAFCITAAPDDAGTFCDRGEKTGIQFGPGCFQNTHKRFGCSKFCQRTEPFQIVTRGDKHIVAVLLEELAGRPGGSGAVFAFRITVLPVADNNIFRQFLVKIGQAVLDGTADDIAVPAGIFLIQQHIVPHHDPCALFRHQIVEVQEVIFHQFLAGRSAAGAAGGKQSRFIAADMEEPGSAEEVIHLRDAGGKDLPGFGIGKAEAPSIRLKEGGVLGEAVERHMLAAVFP